MRELSGILGQSFRKVLRKAPTEGLWVEGGLSKRIQMPPTACAVVLVVDGD